MRRQHPVWTHEAVEEVEEILNTFVGLLAVPTADGQAKRKIGKPHWKVDPDHEAAMRRHWDRYERGETADQDNGCHPLVAVAWRALALAWQEEEQWPKPPSSAETGSTSVTT